MSYSPRMQPPRKRWCEVPTPGTETPDCGARLRDGQCPEHGQRERGPFYPPEWY